MTEHEQAIRMVLGIIDEMINSKEFDSQTLEELAQRIV